MAKSCSWDEFACEVLGLYLAPMRGIATYRKMSQVLREFGGVCRRPADLSPGAIARWISVYPGRRPATVDSYLRSLRAACVYGLKLGVLKSNPFDLRGPSEWVDWGVPDLPPPVHSGEEISRVLALADEKAIGGSWRASRLRAVVYAFAYTGARRRELLGLRVSDVDLVAGTISISTNTRRSLKTRASAAVVPVAPALSARLSLWTPDCGSIFLFPGVRRVGPWLEGPVGGKALDEVKALGVEAGVFGLTFQSFRHSFASLAEGWGFGELALQRILRHTSLGSQAFYRHVLPDVLRDVAGKIRFP